MLWRSGVIVPSFVEYEIGIKVFFFFEPLEIKGLLIICFQVFVNLQFKNGVRGKLSENFRT